jgi:transcription initiation factor TFIIIB Brf1 subunit/transcription initiation factor TFIIB
MSSHDSAIECAWDDMFSCLETKTPDSKIHNTINNNACKRCGGINLKQDNIETVCLDCAVVQDDMIFLTQAFTQESTRSAKPSKSSSHITRLNNWYMWSNEEKNAHKLINYTKDICHKLNIPEAYISNISNTVVMVLMTIKKHDGTKRAKVKDGIILSCIQYVTQGTGTLFRAVDMARKLNMEIKYISKAERIIHELVISKKLAMDKFTFSQSHTSMEYVLHAIHKHKMQIPHTIVEQVEELISLCEQTDVVSDHTPLSIGVACLYYVLKQSNVNFNEDAFAQMYNLSSVTITKTCNKISTWLQKNG